MARRSDNLFEQLEQERADSVVQITEELGQEQAESAGQVVRRRKRQRKGKKYDSRYRQVTAYVRTDVMLAVKHAMTGEVGADGKALQFSELVESLLLDWAEEQGWGLEDVERR